MNTYLVKVSLVRLDVFQDLNIKTPNDYRSDAVCKAFKIYFAKAFLKFVNDKLGAYTRLISVIIA